ncbi:SLAC1 anion channel family protein [Demequina subtropica]|uniref:SLAC1 anion channel family protein n=1 Tax=Demequina subtropica TaxID=1638989 RepID=UPI000783628C|nr:SLAC1 anion channel family protein [Demequina subtropica]
MTTDTAASSTAPPARSLAHLPVGIFAVAMGVGGTAVAWYRLEEAFELSLPVNDMLAGLGLAVVAVALVAYAAKAIRHPGAARAEWTHPVKSAFVATLPVSLMVLATAFAPIAEGVSAALWWPGAALQFIATVLIMRAWIADARVEAVHVHPAWFIPIVGNLVAPLAGVAHAPTEISWYFFGVGALFWLGLLPIVLGRLFLEGTMPWRLAPTLAILVAPPAVASLSWVRLGGSWTDPIAMMLLGVVIFQLALLASQATYLRKVPFAVSAWAYTFPLGAAASALLAAYESGATAFAAWVGVAALATASLLVLGLGWRTAVAVVRGELLTAEG